MHNCIYVTKHMDVTVTFKQHEILNYIPFPSISLLCLRLLSVKWDWQARGLQVFFKTV